MNDDVNHNDDEITHDFHDPHAETHHGENAGGEWFDSKVGAKEDEWLGRSVGEFEIIRIIGIGGMGHVYEAKQMHPHRSVALKIVKSAAATPATLHRFEMESEIFPFPTPMASTAFFIRFSIAHRSNTQSPWIVILLSQE